MPAVMPDVISNIVAQTEMPVIAGGLISSKKDIIEVLKAGAIGASTGKRELWSL
jgi:glycerol uptake operon antiterminator